MDNVIFFFIITNWILIILISLCHFEKCKIEHTFNLKKMFCFFFFIKYIFCQKYTHKSIFFQTLVKLQKRNHTSLSFMIVNFVHVLLMSKLWRNDFDHCHVSITISIIEVRCIPRGSNWLVISTFTPSYKPCPYLCQLGDLSVLFIHGYLSHLVQLIIIRRIRFFLNKNQQLHNMYCTCTCMYRVKSLDQKLSQKRYTMGEILLK